MISEFSCPGGAREHISPTQLIEVWGGTKLKGWGIPLVSTPLIRKQVKWSACTLYIKNRHHAIFKQAMFNVRTASQTVAQH